MLGLIAVLSEYSLPVQDYLPDNRAELYTVQFTLHSTHCTLHTTAQFTVLYTTHYTVHTIYYTVHTVSKDYLPDNRAALDAVQIGCE